MKIVYFLGITGMLSLIINFIINLYNNEKVSLAISIKTKSNAGVGFYLTNCSNNPLIIQKVNCCYSSSIYNNDEQDNDFLDKINNIDGLTVFQNNTIPFFMNVGYKLLDNKKDENIKLYINIEYTNIKRKHHIKNRKINMEINLYKMAKIWLNGNVSETNDILLRIDKTLLDCCSRIKTH